METSFYGEIGFGDCFYWGTIGLYYTQDSDHGDQEIETRTNLFACKDHMFLPG